MECAVDILSRARGPRSRGRRNVRPFLPQRDVGRDSRKNTAQINRHARVQIAYGVFSGCFVSWGTARLALPWSDQLNADPSVERDASTRHSTETSGGVTR